MRQVLAAVVATSLATSCMASTRGHHDGPTAPVWPGAEPLARARRADALLGEIASDARSGRRTTAAIVGIQGLVYSSIGAVAFAKRDDSEDPRSTAVAGGISLGIGLLCTSLGIRQLATTTVEEDLHADFLARAHGDAETAVRAAEHDLAALADKRQGQRGVIRAVGVLVLATGIGGTLYGIRTDEVVFKALGGLGILLGGLTTIASFAPTPVEKTYARWQVELGATVQPTAGGARAPVLGIAGTF